MTDRAEKCPMCGGHTPNQRFLVATEVPGRAAPLRNPCGNPWHDTVESVPQSPRCIQCGETFKTDAKGTYWRCGYTFVRNRTDSKDAR